MKFSKNPQVSVIFLNFNGAHLVKRTLPALLSTNYENFEVIIVDNGSQDESVQIMKQILSKTGFTRYKIIQNSKNLGFSGGNNSALSAVTGDYIVLLSNDVEVESDWMTSMVSILKNNPDIGVAQSMMFDASKGTPDLMGNYINVVGFCHGSFLIPSNMPSIKDVFYSEGAVMWIRKELLQLSLGLFDESYFALYEDIDFCWRIHLLGYKVVVVRDSKVYHTRGSTMKGILIKSDPLLVYYNTRNRLVTLYKNYGTLNALKYVPLAIFLEFLKAIWLFKKGQRKQAYAAICAVSTFILSIPKLFPKRKKVQEMRKVNDSEVIKLIYDLGMALRNINSSRKQLSHIGF